MSMPRYTCIESARDDLAAEAQRELLGDRGLADGGRADDGEHAVPASDVRASDRAASCANGSGRRLNRSSATGSPGRMPAFCIAIATCCSARVDALEVGQQQAAALAAETMTP